MGKLKFADRQAVGSQIDYDEKAINPHTDFTFFLLLFGVMEAPLFLKWKRK